MIQRAGFRKLPAGSSNRDRVPHLTAPENHQSPVGTCQGAKQRPATVCCWQRLAADEPALERTRTFRMAEWTGQKRTLNSIPTEDDPPLDDTSVHVPQAPQAPAATSSPQRPGMTPDQPALPGRSRGSLPPLASNRRPLTEYGSAQRLLGLFTPAPGTELQASDWEQGPSSTEELRKADPALLTPIRPLGGVGLGIGRSTPAIAQEALEAIGDATEATTEAPPTGKATEIVSSPPVAPESPAPAGATGVPEGSA